ncbi:hypothetical protein Tco_0704887 [Tanacetum coccineum]|uniref:Uncharacterized protein n=1 Tax=Tanacetum coccineum TaxID=301880 RepID=A0ABQ4Y4F7_9ASTR
MKTNKALIKDEEAEDVDVHLYRSMIRSLMYLTASRPDIMFAVCACARFQVTPKTSHLNAVKRIFRYLKGQPKLGLWYPRDSLFDLEAFSNSDYARASLAGNPQQEVGDEAVYKELGDRMERAATTASSLEAKQDSGSGPRCQDTILGDVDAQTRFETTSKQSNDPPLSKVNTFGSGKDINAVRLQLMMSVFVYAPRVSSLIIKIIIMSSPKFAEMHNVVAFLEKPIESDGFAKIIDFLKASSIHYALTVNPFIYTSCIEQFWATATVKTVNGVRQLQALIDKKKMIITESSIRSDLHLEDAEGTDCLPTTTIFEELAKMGNKKSKRKQRKEQKLSHDVTEHEGSTSGRMHPNMGGDLNDIDDDAEFWTVMRCFVDATTALPTIPTTVEETLAQAAKPKAKGIVFHDLEKQKDQVALDEDLARNIQAQLDAKIIEEERLERQKQEEANIALIESWENTQAMMKADRLLAERL